MTQDTLNTLLLVSPLAIGAVFAGFNADGVNDTTERVEAWVRKSHLQASSGGSFNRFLVGPLLWAVVKFCDWSDAFSHRGLKTGARVAATLYLLAIWLFVVLTAIKIAIILVIVAAILFVAFKVLVASSGDVRRGYETSRSMFASDARDRVDDSLNPEREDTQRDSQRRVTDIDKYRRGYERAKADIARSRGEQLGDMPEKFVKGVIGLPGEGIRDLFRSADEDRGYSDALNGREFDPS